MLVTGFGPFLEVERNASGEVALALAALPADALGGARVAAGVLPVVFAEVADAVDALLAGLAPEVPGLLLGLGVHRGGSFRLERGARARLDSPKTDNAGRRAAELAPLGERDLATDLDLERLGRVLRSAGADEIQLSDDAGGFVCERAYHHLLARADALGVPALFLHVPPLERVPVEAQVPVVAGLVAALAADLAVD